MSNMLATLTEYARELIVERINAGIAAPKQTGTKFGRPAVNSTVIADTLAIATDARAKGRTPMTSSRGNATHSLKQTQWASVLCGVAALVILVLGGAG